MDEAMIERWNEVVRPQDHVYHLGDFAMGKTAVPNILRRLNGTIHLVWGNHDSPQTRNLLRDRSTQSVGFATSQPYLEVKEAGKLIVLSHYKFQVWNKAHYGSLHFYGHSHGSLPGDSQCQDVGVDCFDYRPVTLAEIEERLKVNTARRPVDHHKR